MNQSSYRRVKIWRLFKRGSYEGWTVSETYLEKWLKGIENTACSEWIQWKEGGPNKV